MRPSRLAFMPMIVTPFDEVRRLLSRILRLSTVARFCRPSPCASRSEQSPDQHRRGGRSEDSLAEFEWALRLNPNFSLARGIYGLTVESALISRIIKLKCALDHFFHY